MEEYRAEPGSERNTGGQTNIFPVDGSRRSESSRDEFMLKIASRWQSVKVKVAYDVIRLEMLLYICVWRVLDFSDAPILNILLCYSDVEMFM